MKNIEIQCVYCKKRISVINDREGGICECPECHGFFRYEYQPNYGNKDIPIETFLLDNDLWLVRLPNTGLKDRLIELSYSHDRMSEVWDNKGLSEEDIIFILKSIKYGKENEERLNVRKAVWKTIYPIFYFEKKNKKYSLRKLYLNEKLEDFLEQNTFISKTFKKIIEAGEEDIICSLQMAITEIKKYITQKKYEVGERNFPIHKVKKNYLPKIRSIIKNPFK